MKKSPLYLAMIVLLLFVLLLPGCAEPKYSILDGAHLEDCVLTIYYDDSRIYRRIPLRLFDYYCFSSTPESIGIHTVTIRGTELKENEQFLALLEMLEGQELPQVQEITVYWEKIQPFVYYSLTSKNGRRLFDVGIGGDNSGTVNFNGEKIPFDILFYSCVEPYLTEPHILP